MRRLTAIACTTLLLFLSALLFPSTRKERFAKYRAIEAYEIRPGVQVTPVYTKDGRVCKAILQKRLYSSKVIDLDADMPREQIYEVFDELAPKGDRGKSTLGLGDSGYETTLAGVAESTFSDFENVSLRMYRNSKNTLQTGYVVAVISWKIQGCN